MTGNFLIPVQIIQWRLSAPASGSIGEISVRGSGKRSCGIRWSWEKREIKERNPALWGRCQRSGTMGRKKGEGKEGWRYFWSYLKKTISIRDDLCKKGNERKLLIMVFCLEFWVSKKNGESFQSGNRRRLQRYPDRNREQWNCNFDRSEICRWRNLDVACERALKQVEERKYDEELRENGVDKILKYGIACYMKRCKVKLAEESYIET